MADKKFTVEVEPAKEAEGGKPSIGPVYRSAFAKDGFPPPIDGMDCCWDVFRLSVEKYPNNRMLGRREIVNGKAGKYVWMTYKEVYDVVMKVGSSIRSCGVEQACNAHGLYCVPLYDTLGAGAVEFIISHAEVTIAFAEEKKMPEVSSYVKFCLETCICAGKFFVRTLKSSGGYSSHQSGFTGRPSQPQ
nr:long chain acyl-CoA synthetase 4-like [Ipomoea batatas]